MPRDCLQDLIYLLHFVNDSELDNSDWRDAFDHPIEVEKDGTATHRTKIGLFEDVYVSRWIECVIFGRWLTADKSRCAGCRGFTN